MNAIASAVALAMLVLNIGLSKIIKEALCLKLTNKREFENLDVDLVSRVVIFIGLCAVEFSVGLGIEEYLF